MFKDKVMENDCFDVIRAVQFLETGNTFRLISERGDTTLDGLE
jgi:hypothetical protein